MKKLIALVIALMLAACVGGTPSAVARPTAAAQADTYRTYTACSAKPDAEPADRCPKRGKKGAFFKSMDADVTYKVCVKFPNDEKLCASDQDAPRRELRINPITSRKVGEHTVTWFVDGDKVGTRHFTIHR